MAGRDGRKKKGVPFLHRHHFYWLFIAFCGYVFFPPMAVLARFGVGKDFFINLLLYICGYIPAVIHNFFCQNIRDNSNRGRSPKWAVKHGLVKDPEAKRSRQRQWAHRYNERAPINPYDDPSYNETDADGVSSAPPRSSNTVPSDRHSRQEPNGRPGPGPDEEAFFNPHEATYGPLPGTGGAESRSAGKGIKTRSKRSGSKGAKSSDFVSGQPPAADYYGSTRKKSRAVDPDTLHHDF